MGLKALKSAGDMAGRLIEAVNNMNSIHNIYKPDYDGLVGVVRATFGADKTLSNLTDAEVNAFFFSGLGDIPTIVDAQTILREWEKNIQTLNESVAVLPANDL